MRESEFIADITALAARARSLTQLLESASAMLTAEVGSATLFLRPLPHGQSFFAEPALSSFNVAEFLESRDFPFRGLYTATVLQNGKPKATLVACFGTWGTSGKFLQAITSHIADQLGKIANRADFDDSAISPARPEKARAA